MMEVLLRGREVGMNGSGVLPLLNKNLKRTKVDQEAWGSSFAPWLVSGINSVSSCRYAGAVLDVGKDRRRKARHASSRRLPGMRHFSTDRFPPHAPA